MVHSAGDSPARDVRVAPHIYRTPHGWRVLVRVSGDLKSARFPRTTTLPELEAFVRKVKDEANTLHQERTEAEAVRRGTFAGDADRYLALKTTQAMPSYSDREFQIKQWVKVFGRRPRPAITARDIDEQLQAFFNSGLSGSTVNKLRTALMSMWTRLDGRAAANPVKETREFPEADEEPRGQSYELIKRILDAVTDRARPVKGQNRGRRAKGGLGALPSPSKAWLELMAWTGMTPAQIGRLTPQHFSIAEGWYTTPRRKKGKQPRFPRPIIRKPMTQDAKAAFSRLVELRLIPHGPFTHNQRSGLRNVWLRALAKAEKQMQEARKDPKFRLPHVRLHDIRHSFGTALYKETRDLGLVGQMLDHSSPRMTRRYALGAVPTVLQSAMVQFERATTRGRKATRKAR